MAKRQDPNPMPAVYREKKTGDLIHTSWACLNDDQRELVCKVWQQTIAFAAKAPSEVTFLASGEVIPGLPGPLA